MNDELNELKKREEARRERNWDARKRWQILQETITWAEANRPCGGTFARHAFANSAKSSIA